ncbi:MAG: tRNA uridine(34) 5-carboxymethylaminomethyl modification radical SAM/GNAT enzyme Elp3 [Candidatus Micrarchaeota archaeon]|nr:tRNA uridine(34) 5-carboxymethylaminomethyl modification radical SAM/GNAT enzyme Elp3 [Candidatus Micrarchaeota archaeon]
MRKARAHSATIASCLAEKSGRLPEFFPRKEKPEEASRLKAAREAARRFAARPSQNISELKKSISIKHAIPFLQNSEILRFIPLTAKKARGLLLKSPTRTLSGVSPVAIMPPPAPCPGKCIYCPRGENAPQSYTGFEPTTMRAISCNYSAEKQVLSRLSQYKKQGHPASKCHLIIMGGTFLCSPRSVREGFMKNAYGALNQSKSKNLQEAIAKNESAPHRAIGVTFETRPDFGLAPHADEMLSMGGTQVELGVQTLSDAVYKKVKRGHTVADVARSTRILRNCGFKIGYHMMPGLFSTPKQDIGYFKQLFSDSRFRPDMLKIYPVLVMRSTPLYDMWEKGEFKPYSTEEAAEVIAQAIRFIPPYVRVSRIQRDIPSPIVSAGVKNSNLRQIVEAKLAEKGERCKCIRCREIGSSSRAGGIAAKIKPTLQRIDYSASGGKEIFLSFEDDEKKLLAGFMRIPSRSHRPEINESTALVRELHVYGSEASLGERDSAKAQHHGLGKKLLSEAEQVAKKEFGMDSLLVLSGPGARGYYRKLGYSLVGAYMAKRI